MKKLFWIFLTVTLFAAAIFCIGASANGSTTTVGNLTFTEYDTYCAVTGCNTSASGSITIPSSVSFSGTTLPVTSIGSSAFYNCSGLTSVTIPDSVTSIGNYAFLSCSSLTSVTIPDSVTSIGSSAFAGCRSLESITVPFIGGSNSSNQFIGYIFGASSYSNNSKYVPSSLKEIVISDKCTIIPQNAFYGCSSLTNVTIGNGVTSIDNRAFYNCSGLTSVTIPDSVKSIGNYAFSGCIGLTSTYITDLAKWCEISFYASTSNPLYYTHNLYLNNQLITHLIIPGGVTQIGKYAFSVCSGLTSVTIADSVTRIGEYAFSGCSGLTSVTIADSVTSIDRFAFSGCNSLTSIIIPEGVTFIGEYAFSECSGLTSVMIPDSVTSIGSSAFYNCVNLAYNEYDNAYYLGNINNPYYALILAKAEITSVEINANTKVIAVNAFINRYSLTSVTIPDGVKSISSSAFYGCNKLTNVTIPDSVTSIDYQAFYNCSGLTSMTIGNGVTQIGNYAFYNCSSLTSVTIPDGVTSIGECAFRNCSSLKILSIPDSVTSIGSYASYSCKSLKLVVYSGDQTQWNQFSSVIYNGTNDPLKNAKKAYGTFKAIIINGIAYGVYDSYCIAVGEFEALSGEIVIPNEIEYNNVVYPVTSIVDSAFSSCRSLTNVTIGDGVTSIGNYAFHYCSSLASVNIPDSVTSIGEYAFYNCYNLTSVTIPDGVTSIDYATFSSCSSLTSVTIPNSVTSIGSSAFYNCSGLINVSIPDSVTSIGDYAFYNCSGLKILSILDGVTSIGDRAFYNCNTLKFVVYSGDQAQWNQISIGNYNNPLTNAKIAYGAKVKIIDGIAYAVYDTYSTVICAVEDLSGDVQIKSEIECDGITLPDVSISESAFSSCSGITTITIPDSITSIGESAFYNCGSLVMIVYGGTQDQWSGITIGTGNDVLSGAKLIYGAAKAIVINGIVYCINDSGCTVIGAIPSIAGYIVIPDEIEYNGATVVVAAIGDNAFSGCTGIVGVTIPADVTSIGEGAFTGCGAIESVYYLGDSTELTVGGGNDNVTQVVVYHTEHTYGEWITDSEASSTTVGHRHRVCSVCGHNQGETIIPVLALTNVSLTLQSDLKINFKADKSLFVNIGYEDPYVIFEMNGRQSKVSEYTVVGDKYVFSFKNIAPDKMNDSIKATLYATYAGKEYSSAEITYSVAAYCYDLLNKTTYADAELRTLVVDLLYYGAASQIYSGHNAEEENLANYLLTDAQRAWRTQDEPVLNRVTNANYYNETVQREVSWKSVGLNLNDSITMRFTFTLSDITDAVLKVRNESGQVIYEIESDKFVKEEDGKYTAYYKGLNAADMSKKVFVTLYRGDETISKTLLYSIESYAAYVKQSNTDGNLVSLVTAMMKYGNSAYAYSH